MGALFPPRGSAIEKKIKKQDRIWHQWSSRGKIKKGACLQYERHSGAREIPTDVLKLQATSFNVTLGVLGASQWHRAGSAHSPFQRPAYPSDGSSWHSDSSFCHLTNSPTWSLRSGHWSLCFAQNGFLRCVTFVSEQRYLKPEAKISPLGLTSPLPLTPGGLPPTSQVMFIHKKSSRDSVQNTSGMRLVVQMFTLGCSPETCIFTGSFPPGGSVRVAGRLYLEKWCPREMGGCKLSLPPWLSSSPVLFLLSLTAFVPDVARPSVHNLKPEQTKATNTKWKSLLGISVPFVFLFLCAKGSDLGEVVFEGKIEN